MEFLAGPLLFVLAAAGGMYALFQPLILRQRRRQKRRKVIVANLGESPLNRRGTRPALGTGTFKQLDGRLRRYLDGLGVALDTTLAVLLYLLFFSGLFLSLLLAFHNFFGALALAILIMVIVPFFGSRYLRSRRNQKLLRQLPIALDMLVRGTRVGVPVAEGFLMVARETEEPIRSHFRQVAEGQTINMNLSEAVSRMATNTSSAEFEFLAAVIAIQQRSGGNLSEALRGLSEVLKARARLREKIQAISMEAKASAAIIGSLPPIVAFMLLIIEPNYISILWTTSIGLVALAICACWMAIGIAVMRAMISFEI